MALVHLDGELVAAGEARIPVLDRGLLNGYGLFETLRAYGGRPWAFEDHYERLARGSELLDIDVPAAGVLHAAMLEVLGANGLDEAGIRLTITGGSGPVDVQADPDSPGSVVVIAWPVRDYSALYERGASLVTLTEGRPLAGVKTTSYAVSVAGRVFARRAGADDAVFLGPRGRVLEATGSNIFVVRGRDLLTPPLDETILPGVTRKHVMDVAREIGYTPGDAVIDMDDVLTADEVLLTSSLREVYPAASIDGKRLGRSGAAEALRGAYRDLVRRSLG